MESVVEIYVPPPRRGSTDAARFAIAEGPGSRLPEAAEFATDDPAGFRARIWRLNLGRVTIESLTTTGRASMQIRRTTGLIRQFDPECYRLLFSQEGCTGVAQGGREEVLRPGEMGFHDTSRPHHGWRRAGGAESRLLMVAFPRECLALHPNKVRALAASRLGADGVGRLVAATLTHIIGDARGEPSATAARLADILVDLIAVRFGEVLDERVPLSPEARQRTLFRQIQAFIEDHLRDPELTPAAIAAAHHIAPRTLYRLFAEHGSTVQGWIRQRRLRRCWHELIEPHRMSQPIYAIAGRYGFADAAHFTRSFRAEFGLSPAAHRQAQVSR